MKVVLLALAASFIASIAIGKLLKGTWTDVADDLNTAWPASAYTPDPDNWADPT